MDGTLAPAIFKPEKNLVFFQDKIAGARDAAPGKLDWLAVNNLVYFRAILVGPMIVIVSWSYSLVGPVIVIVSWAVGK